MAYTQTQLDALKDAAAKGVLEVEYDGQRVKYQSLNALLRMISIIERSLSGQTVHRTVYGTSNGMR